MKRTQKQTGRDLTTPAAPRPKEEASAIKLRIEELEPRLAPQSTAAILE